MPDLRRRLVDLRRRWGVVAALLAVAVLALTGCSPHSGNAAAYVNGVPISDATLNRVSAGVATYLDPSTTVNESGVLAALVRGQLALAVGDEKGINITDSERDQFIAQQAKVNPDYQAYAAFLNHPDAQQVVYATADADLMTQRLGGEKDFVQAAKQIPMKLNPRYGDWVFTDTSMGIRQGSSGSLSNKLITQ